MINKKDPLIESVQKIMIENEVRRTVTNELNEELGIQSINNLPHEYHGKYKAILEQNINAALLESAPTNAKEKSLAKLYGNPDELTHGDVLRGRGVVEEDQEQLDELDNQTYLNYLGKSAPDSDAIEDMGRSFYRQGKATKILSKYNKGMSRANAALKKRGMSDDQIMAGTSQAASKFAETQPRKLQKLTEKITAKTDMGDAIREFEGSTSKQLEGRSKESRREAAIAAVLQARREKK